MSNLVGVQTQWDSAEALRYLEMVGPRYCMGINVFKREYLEKVRDRGAQYIYRHHPNFDEIGLTPWFVDPETAAEEAVAFLRGHLGDVLDFVDYVVDGNEYILGPDHETPERIALADRYMAAFIRDSRLFLGKGSIVGNFNTGHWGPETVDHFPLMLQALQEDCEANPENGSRTGWHEYNWPLLRDDGHWHTAKFLRAMPPIVERYPHLRCLITEVGIDRSAREWGAGHEGFRKAHPDINVAVEMFCGDDGLAWYVDRMLEAGYVDGCLIFGCGMTDWRTMGFDVMNSPNDTAVPERISLLPDAAPPEPPDPPEPPEDPMTIKVVDKEYVERDFPWAETKYGVAVRRAEVEPGQKVYRLTELWEKTGTTSLVSQVLDEDGRPISNKSVAFYWSDAPDPPEPATEIYPHDWYRKFVHGPTNANGDVGPGMGTGAYHGEGEGGPHAVWVRDPNIPSDICEKLGMLAGTFHDHLDQKFRLAIEGEGSPPNGNGDVLVLQEVVREAHAVSALAIAYPTSVAIDTRGDGRGPGVDEDLHPKEWVHPDGTAMAMVELTTDFEGSEPRTYTLRVYRMSDGASLTNTESETFLPLGAPRERVVYVYVKAGEEPPDDPEPPADLLAAVLRLDKNVADILSHLLKTPPESPEDAPYWAQYYANKELSGPPVLERHEDTILHDWGGGAPPGVPSDDFSARWTSNRWFDVGTWIFHFRGDDGMRLYVDGVPVFDQWHDQSQTSYEVEVVLSEGLHDLEMHYYERGGRAVCKMWYEKG